MSKSYIKQLIESYQNSKLGQRIGAGVLTIATGLTLLTSCNDHINVNNPNDTGVSIEETTAGNVFNPGKTEEPGTYQPAFSQTYLNAKNNWDGILWFGDKIDFSGKNGFQLKCAPFNFLQEQGVVECDEKGYLYAIGNEDYRNNGCIQTRAFVDENSKENDLYLLVQYVSAPIVDKGSNGDTFVSTWMLKYTLDADCYKDLLAIRGDFKLNLLIQQIDEEYTPKVISHSLINHDVIGRLQVFKNISKTENQYALNLAKGVNNYIENIDYENLTITVNFTPKDNTGTIYSYTYKLKETPNWYYALENTTPKGYVENLTNEEIMIKSNTFLGDALSKCDVVVSPLAPSAEQKSSAGVKYGLTNLDANSMVVNNSFEAYENGRIKYEQINPLTQNFASGDEYSK